MSAHRVHVIAAGFFVLATVGAPTVASAQRLGYDDEPSIVVECGAGQRAVMEQRRINGRTQVVARCERAQVRNVAYDEYGRVVPASSRVAASRQSRVSYVERAPRRTKTKSALLIAGSAATGAGVGGALKGKKGALIGAAIGGGAASIYDASKRR